MDPSISCDDIHYLCASFNMGDSPVTLSPGGNEVPFNVYGVESASNSTVNPDRLVGCTPFNFCTGMSTDMLYFKYRCLVLHFWRVCRGQSKSVQAVFIVLRNCVYRAYFKESSNLENEKKKKCLGYAPNGAIKY